MSEQLDPLHQNLGGVMADDVEAILRGIQAATEATEWSVEQPVVHEPFGLQIMEEADIDVVMAKDEYSPPPTGEYRNGVWVQTDGGTGPGSET